MCIRLYFLVESSIVNSKNDLLLSGDVWVTNTSEWGKNARVEELYHTDAKLRLDTSLVGKAVMLLIGYVHNSFDDMRSRHLPTSFSDDLMMRAVPILMRFCLAPRYKNHMQKSGHFPKYSQPNLKLDWFSFKGLPLLLGKPLQAEQGVRFMRF